MAEPTEDDVLAALSEGVAGLVKRQRTPMAKVGLKLGGEALKFAIAHPRVLGHVASWTGASGVVAVAGGALQAVGIPAWLVPVIGKGLIVAGQYLIENH